MAAKRKKASGGAKKRARTAPAKKAKARKAPAKRRRGSSVLRGPKGRAGGGDVNFSEITLTQPSNRTNGASCQENGGSWFSVSAGGNSRTDVNVTTFAAKGTNGVQKSTSAGSGNAFTNVTVTLDMNGNVTGVSGPKVAIPAGDGGVY